MSGTFAESLALIEPRISQELATDAQRQTLRQLAERLPPLHRGGFEYQLGAGPGLDLQQAVDGTAVARARFHRFASQAGGQLASSLSRLDGLLNRWAPSEDNAISWLKRLWLEFDASRGEVAVPSVFLSLAEALPVESLLQHAEQLCETLSGHTLTECARQALRSVCRPGPAAQSISDLGCMASREAQALRLILPCQSAEEVRTVLGTLEWKGDFTAALDWCHRLFRVARELRVCIDTSDTVLPGLGLEIPVNADRGDDETAVALSELFVQRGFCLPEERVALLSWPGLVTPQDVGGPWPRDIVADSIMGPTDSLTAMRCRFSHFKVSLGVSAEPIVKAYFGYFETWLKFTEDAAESADSFAG